MKKKLLYIAAVFFVLLFMGIVYAAETNAITFTGRVARTDNLNLELRDISLSDIRFGEIVEFSDANRKSMRFYVLLTEPGDSRIISFYIYNSGNMAAKLSGLNVNNPEASMGVALSYSPLENVVVLPGGKSGPHTVTVSWDITEQDLPSGSFDIAAFINYSQT